MSKFKKLLLGISIFIGLGILVQSLYPAGFTNISEFIAGDGITLQKYRNQLVISRDAPAYGPDDTINVLGINTSDLITKGPWVDVRAYATLALANTAAYSAGKTLLITQECILPANTTLTAAVKIIKGGSLTKISTYTLTINGPFEADLYKVFSGFTSGDVTFGPGTVKEIHPEWWGLTYTAIEPAAGVMTANVTSMNCAVQSFPSGQGKIKLGGPICFFNGEITIGLGNTQIQGLGESASQVYLVPSVANVVLFNFTKTVAGMIYNTGLSDIGIVGNNSGNASVAIRITDATGFKIKNVRITTWSGASSIGLQSRGRDECSFTDFEINADIPISIEENPNYATTGVDHFNFHNLKLFALDHTKSLIIFEAGTNSSNISFSGIQAWIGGNHGVDANGVGALNRMSASNIRREGDQVDPLGGYLFYINPVSNSGDFTCMNCYSSGNGWYLRKLYDIALVGCKFVDAAGVALDMDETCGRVGLYNFSNGGGTISVGALYKSISGGLMNNGMAVMHSPFAYYTIEENPPVWADNATAIANGLDPGDIYKTATGQLMIVY